MRVRVRVRKLPSLPNVVTVTVCYTYYVDVLDTVTISWTNTINGLGALGDVLGTRYQVVMTCSHVGNTLH